MTVLLSISTTILFFSVCVLSMVLSDSKSNISMLKKLNQELNDQVTDMETRNAMLWYELELEKEKDLIEPGTQVSWLDKQGETNFGSVLDDYVLKNKTYVVVIRMKDGKTQGAPISIPFSKLTVC